ncbi:MAG: GDYXXLXY domain-containing protein [Proteobacteria bacterium]|nr:GDYXXLXY domain-containing protein [Pseudomonadota bacterium]
MSRAFLVAVIAALVLPVLALAALVGHQELLLANARILSVPLTGFDPRDLLRGHYIRAQMDWDWERAPAISEYEAVDGALCVLAETPKPRVRFLPGWKAGDRIDADCRLVIAGQARAPSRFAPSQLDNGDGAIQLYVPEARASDLEKLMRERPGSLTVDLAVRADGVAAIKALRIDGQKL